MKKGQGRKKTSWSQTKEGEKPVEYERPTKRGIPKREERKKRVRNRLGGGRGKRPTCELPEKGKWTTSGV